MAERILIVNVNWLGDVLFSTPLIRALREKFPNAYIASTVVPRCKEVLELNPSLDEIIIYDEEDRYKGFFAKLGFISYLKSKNFDTAIFLHRSFTRAMMVFLAGINKRLGYYNIKRSLLLTDEIRPPIEQLHRVDFFLNLGKPFGIAGADRNYEFFISGKNRRYIKDLLREEGVDSLDILVALNPGGNWEPKRWPRENFARLANELTKRFDAKIIITGAAKDVPLAEEIASQMEQRPIIACGKTSLKDLAALFQRVNLVIANDSGPMHIAVSMGANTIALFGPTSPEITGPIGKGRHVALHKKAEGCEIPCYNLSCTDYRCMERITVEDVLKAAEQLLVN